MAMQWIKSLVRRLRIARYRRREIVREMHDQGSAEHVERAHDGIKEPPQGGPSF